MSILATELEWPEGTKFFEVQCRLGIWDIDGEDANKAPDVKTLGGTVRITPRTQAGRIRLLEPDGKYRVVVTTPLTFAINESTGRLVNTADYTEGVWVVDPASDTIDPKDFTYSAVVTPKVGSPFTVEFDGTVAINGVYDLANGATVAPLRGDSLLESRIAKLELEGGPVGPPGPKGDKGADSTVPGPKGDKGDDSTVPGPKGEQGDNGRGVESITDDDEDGIATVLYTDGATGALPLPHGPQGDPAPLPEIAWAGDVLTVDGVSSPPLTGPAGPAPDTSWSGTSLIVGNNPPVDLQGPQGMRGPIGSPGAVATSSDYLLVGPGRPDTPATTGGVITGSEPVGCEYRSTDGAGVGAWVWTKRSTGWTVTNGDTGWRKVTAPTLVSSGIYFRRIGAQVFAYVGDGDYRLFTFTGGAGAAVSGVIPGAFTPKSTEFLICRNDSVKNISGVIEIQSGANGFMVIRPSGNSGNQTSSTISYLTTKAWPSVLPGSPA